MFVDRRKELKILEKMKDGLKRGERENIALIGSRRIGKTELLLKFKNTASDKETIIPYINVQRVGNIDSFVFLYLKELLFDIGKRAGEIKSKIEIADLEDIIVLATKLKIDAEVRKIISKKGIDALDLLLEIQETILEKTGFFCIFLLDEFQYVENFGEEFLEVMRSIVEKQKKIAYIVTGSSVSLMEKILSRSKEPFFAQFRRIYLRGLLKQDAKELARVFLKRHELGIDDMENNVIYKLSGGHPFYTVSICRRLVEEFDEVNMDRIMYAFLKETLSPEGDICLVLDYIYNESLSRAYKGKEHRQILLTLAKKDGLTLSDVSRTVGKTSGEVSNYLKVLLKTDLLVKEDGRYYFKDPLLRFWLAETYLGISREDLKQKDVREKLIKDLEEKFQRVSSELGRAKEYEIKDRLMDEFNLELGRYISQDGKIEFDLLGKKNGVYHIFEVKWREKPSDYRDVKNFLKKVKNSVFSDENKILYFVSKHGFTSEAEELAQKNSIKLIEKI